MQHLGNYEKFKFDLRPNGRYEVWTNNQVSKGGSPYTFGKDGMLQCTGVSRVLDTLDAVEMGLRTGASDCVFRAESIDECKCFVS